MVFVFWYGIVIHMINYIDIHSHLHDTAFDIDRSDVLARMREEGVSTITIGTDIVSSKQASFLAEHEENVFASVGIHPRDDEHAVWDPDTLVALASRNTTVAIGECGLDYFGGVHDNEKRRQQELFERHIDLALTKDLPLMLHVRDAYDDTLAILEERSRKEGGRLRGNVHFFVGDNTIAKRFLDIGFTVSFTGVITFTHDYDEVVAYVPNTMIMAETDAPYVAPVPFRGKRNEPVYVREVYARIAAIRGCSESDVRKHINSNACRFFALEKFT
jgi:TatD DNase family protein